MSIVWRFNPHFPDNMPIASLLAWTMLPLMLTMAWHRFARMGLEPKQAWILCALAAINAHVVWFAMNLMPELAFISVLLACTVMADSDCGWWGAGVAGVLGGMAYLLKSAALPLLITSPLLFLFKRQWRSAALFCGAMSPFVAGWMWWARAHHFPPRDATWTFYTDYFAYQALNVPLRDYPLVFWVNVKTLLSSLGQLIAAPDFGGTLGHIPAYAGAVIASAGSIILARRKGLTHYHAFALGLLPMLALWHYPPLVRFVLPLLPLLLAGLLAVVLEAWRIVSERTPGPRRAIAQSTLVAFGMLAPLAAAAVYGGPMVDLYRVADRSREQRAAVIPEYRWIAANTPANATFVASDDAVLYLYTGRPAMALHIPPKLLYHEDRAGIAQEYGAMEAFAARNHLSYLLRTNSDFNQDFMPSVGRTLVDGVLADVGHFRLVHSSRYTAIYEAAVANRTNVPQSCDHYWISRRSDGGLLRMLAGCDLWQRYQAPN